MYKRIAFLLFLTFPVLAVKGQGTTSLSDAIDYALTNHPEVRVAQLNVRDAEWRIKENKATGLPQVTLGVNYNYFLQQPAVPAEAFGFPGEPGQKLTFALRNNLSGKLAVNQLLFNNSYLMANKAARLYRQYVELQL